ncbi:hypothetical protein Q644_20000 [Brucella intermedia 229E]|uniref:Uncharacterized protein n=1 Tax=Brucella intermedia 229E TaxID=1337887 RepID=U4VG68_9HYPH|nr:hypothetical protein Q644_20000 [Brucella intermedia 229E]
MCHPDKPFVVKMHVIGVAVKARRHGFEAGGIVAFQAHLIARASDGGASIVRHDGICSMASDKHTLCYFQSISLIYVVLQ